ncbi:undecaprenyl-diphosphatase [Candidatus Berkelbacteria bacterium CG10_big_fil_rev_8_21_14_0_10_43_13]|uniref:Undecaprenyl-diphosphatase n=1 Tax=Candidatus Berkelbacteria bacterium CG10_big_fil_rev_8_21_14_0_10_43_13 TaxID=1974514 RepID=A0A2H0W5X8_9BACT|nr:MAG: undecaprenyl-diphosphatase [Candidatus Berkelbacteria bacterium CG10_big_fil_rev_8_21_14_0_10_43_13]
MTILHSIILGIIEGITEFLPISSTAHLVLVSHLLQISQSEFVKTFEISIQFGAILAVLYLYWQKIFHNFEVLKRIIVAFIPTGILGLIFYKVVKNFLLEDISVIIWAMILGGVFLILFERWHQEKAEATAQLENITYKQCLVLGVFQSFAMVPGVSRSAATIIGGLFLGLKRKTIVEFSFLLALPTMLAAAGYDLIKTSATFTSNDFFALGIGFAVSFVVAVLAIKFLLDYVRKHDFTAFGIYRIVAGIVLLLTL